MNSRRPAAILTLFTAFLAGAVLRPVPAVAKVPGPNGRIAYGRNVPAIDDTISFTIDPDGTDRRRLFAGTSEFPHWSPDGERIAILACADPPTCRTAAVIVDPQTGAWYALPMPDPDLFLPCPVWSSDGRRLACGALSDEHPRRNGIYSIRSSDGGGLRRITSNPGGEDFPGDYSPDGSRLVFLRTDPERPPRANQALFLVNVDGTDLRRISPWGLSNEPGSWSPDGSKILFAGGGLLFVLRLDHMDIRHIQVRVRGFAGAFDPGWSPNGRKIVFAMVRPVGPGGDLQGDIYTADADGTAVRQVTDDAPLDEVPDWGPALS